MVILKGAQRFEMSVEEHYGEWVAKLLEFIPDRLWPTQHLLRAFATHEAAVEAIRRRWHILFPDDAPLQWREPSATLSRRQSQRQ